MTKQRIVLVLAGVLFVSALAAAGAAGTWLLYTEGGLAWLSTRAIGLAGKGLTLEGIAGTLAGGARVQAIRYVGDDIEVRVRDAQVRVSPWSLLILTPRLYELRAAELAVVTKPGEPRGRPPDTLALPANFQLADAHVARLVIDLGKGPLDLTDVKLAYSGGRSRHRVHGLSLNAFEHAIDLKGTIEAAAPFDLEATLSALSTSAPQTGIQASFGGNLSALTAKGTATSGGARIDATASVEPYAGFPLAALKATIAALDLRAFGKTLPHTAIEGEVDLARTGAVLVGPVRLTNAASGPYDQGRLPVAALRVTVRTDAAVHRFDLAADLGRGGAIAGSGEVRGDTAELALSTKNLNLAGLVSTLRETKLAGRADITAATEKQSVKAELREQDITLRFVANRAGERIDVPEFRAAARGGEARGHARIAMTAQRPFSAEASFARFDPAAWGRFPAGSVNGTVSAKGSMVGPQVDLRIAIRDSRLYDAPLSAQGTLALTGERLREADLEASIGGNRIFARGAFGAPKDTLALRVDAPRPGVFDKRIRGTVKGSAQASGTWRAPSVRFDLTGADLAHADYGRVKALDAKGAIAWTVAGPLEVNVSARGIVAPDWQLRSAALRVQGTRAAHAIALEANGERVDFRARAKGGWQPASGWSGVIEELVNSGEAAASLAGPVALNVGPQRVRADPFELRLVGGRLHVSALNYERGRLSTAGRFTDLPVRPLLALAGGPAAMAGTLRLTGHWSIESAPQLTGSVEVRRESGDVALGAQRPFALGLQRLSFVAKIAERGATFHAELGSVYANASAEGRVSPVGSGENARYTRASPLAFTAAIDVARLAPFATFIDTALLLDGALHAKLKGEGTVGSPLVTGPLTGERIALALPAEGIELKDGTLKAVLTQREVRVESFAIRGGDGLFNAQGTLARTGYDEASVDWRAERFTVLARPDRRLVVSGKGNASLRGGKLAFTGALRANEGLFELATTSLPTLGDDVVIVGSEPATVETTALPPTSARKATRAAVDMSIDLGDNVHVRGRGLDVWLAGTLRVQTDAQGQLRATGTVDARRGTFVAYGQRLEVDRGRFFFNGPLTNPALDIVAMRKRMAVEAGVAVTGTMQRPLVRVVSNPPLPEGEALSWLVLGRAPTQAGAGQLSALPLATTALMSKAGSALGKALHVDDIGVTSGGSGGAQQMLTVGKRLTERLYLAFEQSLGGTENLLRLEMSLTERIALRAQAGLTSSVGIYYRYFWD